MQKTNGRRVGVSLFYRDLICCLLGSMLFLGGTLQAVPPPTGVAPVLIPTGGFAIDGDLQANTPAAGAGDWLPGPVGPGGSVLDATGTPLNPATTFHFIDLYNSGADNTFAGGLKWTDDPNTWTWSTGSASSKTDINNVLMHIATDANGHSWLVIAADRASTSGDSYIDFEFLQSKLTVTTNNNGNGGTFSSAGPNGGRTLNDLLLSLAFTSGGSVADFFAWRWQTNVTGGGYTYVDSTASLPTGGVFVAASPANTAVPFGAFGGTTYAVNQFAEAAVDLTALLGNFDPCLSIGVASILVKTKSSQSSSSTIVDFINPIQYTLRIGPSAYAGLNQTNCTQGATTAFNLQGQATQGLQPIASTAWSVVSGSATIDSPSSLSTTAHVSSSSATLRLTVLQSNGCKETSDVILAVAAMPACSISGAASVCPLSSSQFLAPAGLANYSWTISGNGSISGATNGQVVTVTAGATCGATFTLALNITNNNGCFSSCSSDVLVQNTAAPAITGMPSDVTVQCAGAIPLANDAAIAATSACNGPLTIAHSEQTIPGSCPNNFIVQRTYTATDSCGNTSSQVQTITVNDTTPPAISSIPADVTVQCAGAVPAANDGAVIATDNCGGTPVISHSDQTIAGSCVNNFVIKRTYMATDACGLSSSKTQTITVNDTTAPVISSIPADVTVECASSAPAANEAAVVATDNCGGTPVITHSDQTIAGTCANKFTIKRTYTATDACGNSSSKTQTITVNDDTAPIITSIPVDVAVQCAGSVPVANDAAVSATDNCGGTPVITHSDQTISGTCANKFTIKRTYTATDACGNTSSQTQTITVNDTTPPTITSIPADLTVECASAVPAANDGAVMANDACGGTPVVTHSDQTTPGTCANKFIIKRTYTATDACGNTSSQTQTITVNDDTPPVITSIPADVTVQCAGAVPAPNDAAVIATDNCGGAPVVTHSDQTITGTCVNKFTVKRTYTATDACGNTSSLVQTITVNDTTPPTITSIPGDVTLQCASAVSTADDAAVVATDACGGTPVVTHSDQTIAGSCANKFTIKRTYTAIDACGNSASQIQTITVNDTTPPTITSIPADVSVQCAGDVSAANNGAVTATDACGGTPVITHSELTNSGTCANNFVIKRTYTATDACGNSSSQVQTITVQDTIPPVVTAPANVTIACSDSLDPAVNKTLGSATAVDNCTAASTPTYSDQTVPGNCAGNYTVKRTWSSVDACGNIGTALQTITVQDIVPPVVTPPANVTIASSDSQDPNVNKALGFATAVDNCSGASTPTYTDQIIAGNCACDYTIKRTWTSHDGCGNLGSAVQTITVQDIVPPVVTPPSNVTIACTDSQNPAVNPVLGIATAVDNCTTASTPTYSDQIVSGNCAGNYTIKRTWSSSDACGNVGTALQTITVRDTIPPTITVPINVTLECGASTAPSATGTASAQDGCSGATVTYSDVVSNLCGGSKIITRTWTATDGCGNAASGVQTISVLDRTPPSIWLTYAMPCTYSQGGWGGGGTPGQIFQANYTKVFTNGLTLGIYDPANGNSAPNGLYWQGNSTGLAALQAAVSQGNGTGAPITQDAVNPTGTFGAGGLGRQTLALTFNVGFNAAGFLGGANSFGTLVYVNTGNDSLNGFTVSQILGVANQALAGLPLPTGYDFSALSGLVNNLNISFESCTMSSWAASHLTAPTSMLVQCPSQVPPPNPATVSASDTCSSPVTITALPDAVTDYICPTRYTLKRVWVAQDACGNTNTVAFFIQVSNSIPPSLTLPANLVLECTADTSPNSTGSAVAHGVCGAVSVTYSDIVSNTCGGSGVIYRTWTATDGCNATNGIQTITVRDTTPPVVTVPANITIACTDSLNPTVNTALGQATAVDSCSGASKPAFADQVIPGSCAGNYTVKRTWSSTDACGNTGTALQVITVQDTLPPVVTAPANVTIACSDSLNPSLNTKLGVAAATDGCSGASTPTFSDQIVAGNCAGNFTVRRTWSSHDNCGNVGTALQLITVQDTVAPVVTAPASVTIACTDSLNPSLNAALGVATATDGCSGASSPTYSDQIIPGNCAGNYAVKRTWSSHDGCGNVGTALQTITVQDTTPPSITAPANLVLPFTADIRTNSTGVASASDGCSGVTLTYHDVMSVQGDGSQLITRTWTATDGCGNSASAVQTITLDSPSPLILPKQNNITLTDLTTVTVINTATNPNVPANPITYQLINPPAGASINNNGIIAWTPALGQSPSTNLITTVVTTTVTSAAGSSTISSTNSFLVTISTPYDGLDMSVDTDGDGLTNLVEYAVGSDPNNSADANSRIIIWITQDNSGNRYLAMKYARRVNAAALGLQYLPEVSADKVSWASDSANVLGLGVTSLDSEFDWVTVRDQTPITPSMARFIRLHIISTSLESFSPVWIGSDTLVQGTTTGTSSRTTFFSQRMVLPVLYAGTVSSLQNTALTDTNATWTSSEFGSGGVPAYAEFDNGEMVDIASSASTSKSLGLAGSLGGMASAGDAYRIRAHFTIASLFGTNNETGLKSGGNTAQADNVMVLIPQTQQTLTIFYYDDGVNHGWLTADYTPADQMVVYPEQGLLVRRVASGDRNVYLCGPVKTGVTVAPVQPGYNLVGTLKSLSPLSLSTLNLYTGNSATGMASGGNTVQADTLLVVQPDGTTATYFYYKDNAGNEGWLDANYNLSAGVPIKAGSAFFIHRLPASSGFSWTIPAE